MGYPDYSIYRRETTLAAGSGGFALVVRLSESNGYDPSESRLEVSTRGLPNGQYVLAFAELVTGAGFLAW